MTSSAPDHPADAVHERSRKKLEIRLFLVGAIGVLALAGLAVSSQLISAITRSEQTEAIFNAAAELPPDLVEAVRWGPDPADLPRPMEPLTRVDLTASWLRAWEQQRIVAETGDTSGLEVYYSGSALDGVLASAPAWQGRSVEQLGHQLRLRFYSEDGQVVGLAAESDLVRSEQVGEVTWAGRERFDAVLVLEDGNWRIRHLVRRAATGDWETAAGTG